MFRLGVTLGVLVGLGFLVSKLLAPRVDAAPPAPEGPWPRLAEPLTAWVEPVEGGCPVSHPVKAKLSSKIFHVPGGASYDRTSPDRCYVDAAHAEADGLRAAKR